MPDIKTKLREYRRILQIARKPGKDEFVTSAKVTSIGLLVIGIIGFVIFLIFVLGCSTLGILC
ncbi:MAG: protein translocase SEC61 complex subunit gamma [Candidatus Aenigmarchaeota archaeon]|nr:protein translocase SEC61 complex subunit gamma [Candidatus Aenigmarchaeota archaeon]